MTGIQWVALAVVAPAALLAGCGGNDGPTYTQEQKDMAADFCTSSGDFLFQGMGLDQYAETAEYDRCVQNAVKVTACLRDAAANAGAFAPTVPEVCYGKKSTP